MNLYRNFGALLEVWVADSASSEGSVEVAVLAAEVPTLSQNAFGEGSQKKGILLKSESEDSGLEETPATPQGSEQSFSLTKDSEQVDDGGSPQPTSLSPSFLEPCNQSQFIVEQALERTKWASFEGNRKAFCPTLINSWTLPTLVSQRLGELEAPAILTQTAQPSKPEDCQQKPTPKQKGFEVEDKLQHKEGNHRVSLPLEGSSFGLTYLEQVCRLLEEIARLRARNQELEREIEKRQQTSQDFMSSQFFWSDSKIGDEEPVLEKSTDDFSQSSCENLPSFRHFRQRSLSDAHIIDLDIGRLKKPHWSGSTGNLLTEADSGSQSTVQKGKAAHMADNVKRTSWKQRDKQSKDSNSEPISTSEGQKSSQHFGLLFKKMSKKKSSS